MLYPLVDSMREMDSLFDYVSGMGFPSKKNLGFLPATDVIEDDKNFYLEVELPGLTEKDIQLNIKNNHLILEGEKKSKQVSGDDESAYRIERRYGSFKRSFLLPDNVDKDAINAEFESGVLKICVPKGKDKSVRNIGISTKKIAS